jgi:lysophospholipase L1-like esterase
LFSPAAQPWDEDPLWLWNMDDAENQFAQNQLDFWARRGHFDAANYDADGDQARSFVRMVRAYRKLGAKVYVVIMPLRSTVREKIPANAKPCLLEALDRAFPEAPPAIIDFQEAMPDKYFTDEAHLSKAGAERLSRMVAERLRTPEASSSAPDGS